MIEPKQGTAICPKCKEGKLYQPECDDCNGSGLICEYKRCSRPTCHCPSEHGTEYKCDNCPGTGLLSLQCDNCDYIKET